MQKLANTLFRYLLLLIAFILPVYIHLLPLLIALLVIAWLAGGQWRERGQRLASNHFTLLLSGFYLMHLIGMLWTDNLAAGGFDLEIKLSLLIFPLLLGSSHAPNKQEIIRIYHAFIAGCVTAGCVAIAIATVQWLRTGENHFVYTLFSYVLHPSYLAMYLNLGVLLLLHLWNTAERGRQIMYATALLFLALNILLLASKTGIIALIFIIMFFSVRQIILYRKWLLGAGFLVGTLVALITVHQLLPYTIDRLVTGFQSLFADPGSGDLESNTTRLLVWKSDLVALKDHLWIGTGTGDVKDILVNTYTKLGFITLAEERLNAHSQYFQSALALGLPGIVLLLGGILLPMIRHIRSRKYLYPAFALLILFNFTVESMLEVQAGTIFFGFWASLLILYEPHD